MINLQSGTVEIEPVGDYSQGFWRDQMFFQQSPDSQLVNMPRLFVHSDGSTTIAVAPVEQVRREAVFAMKSEGGPKDTIEALQHVPYGESQLQAAEKYARHGMAVRSDITPGGSRMYLERGHGADPDAVRAGGRFPAGFTSRKMAARRGMGSDLERTPDYGASYEYRPQLEDQPLAPETIPYARKGGGSRTPTRPAGYPKSSRIGPVEEVEPIWGASRQLTPEHSADPHLVTARDAARVLLRKGMSGDTKINVRVTPGTFAHAPEEQAAWTLRDLVNQEFGLTDLGYLQEEASHRGLRAIPKGKGVILRAQDGSYTKEFSSQVEALEAVGRLPAGADGPKIERELERSWGFGYERSYDADIDSDIFRPVELMQSGIEEMMVGRRPLVTLWSRDENNLRSAVAGMAQAAKLDPNAFTVLPLGTDAARGRTNFAVFNDLQVKQQLARFAPALKHVGVDVAPSVDETLRRLAQKKHGLSFLYGGDRDPMDALLYTYLRERGEKELWSKAQVGIDSLGPYRKFSAGIRDEVKARNLRGQSAQMDPAQQGVRVQMPSGMAAEGPAGGGPWRDLQDEVPTPGDFYFTPRDADGPPPMAELGPEMIDDAGEILGDTSSPISKLWNRFRIPQEMFKYLEEHTHVPFYQWYSSVEAGRAKVEAATKEHFGNLAKLARPFNREDRKRVQLLLETKFSDTEAYTAMKRTVSPQVQEATDAVEGMYRSFYKDLGYHEKDIAEALGNFPQIRQSGKTYKAWAQGRSGLPKLMTDLSNPIGAVGNDLGTGSINLDERDLNFHTIARRVFRASANAKHLKPIWDDVNHALGVFAQSKSSSTELSNYFDYFRRYATEAIHQPDEITKSMHNFMKGSWKSLFKQDLPDDEVFDLISTMTSFNYYANMAFQVGMVGRNYLQTLQTTYPAIGGKHTGAAIRYGLKWRKDAGLQKQMMDYGVIARDAYVEPLRDVQRFIAESSAADKLGSAPAKIMDALDKGVQWYQSADNFNRVVAFRAQYTKAREAADDFLAKKSTWTEFIDRSGARNRVEGWDSGLGVLVKEALVRDGNADLASALLAKDFMTASQFLYSRGNVPYAMQSSLGRFFGQYGTWPAYYVEFMINQVRRGSPREKVEFLGRWAASNAAVYGGLGYAFGADFSRWTFLAPTSYTGGPMAQIALQASAAYNAQVTGEQDPAAKIQGARFTPSKVIPQMLPIPSGALRNYWNAVDEMSNENWDDATRRFLGLPKQKGTMGLPPPF
jgi:hypothetical protein